MGHIRPPYYASGNASKDEQMINIGYAQRKMLKCVKMNDDTGADISMESEPQINARISLQRKRWIWRRWRVIAMMMLLIMMGDADTGYRIQFQKWSTAEKMDRQFICFSSVHSLSSGTVSIRPLIGLAVYHIWPSTSPHSINVLKPGNWKRRKITSV